MANNIGKIVTKSALTNWQIGGSHVSSGCNEMLLVGNRACYITIVKLVQTANGAEVTPSQAVKKNAYVNAGYTWSAEYQRSTVHIFAYTV